MNKPFSDKTPKGSVIIHQGEILFLQTAIERNNVIVEPDADAFRYIDVTAILDPDGNDVTSSWVTNEKDPDDDEDVWDASHSTYVGGQSARTVTDAVTTSGSAILTSATAAFAAYDVGKPIGGNGIPGGATIQSVDSATQVTMSANATVTATGVSVTIGEANTGLFHDGSGNVAQKVKAPTNAEKTRGSTTRFWKIRWKLRKNGIVVGQSDGSYEETFHVDEPGVLVFSTGYVTVDEVKRAIVTALTNTQIEEIIVEASDGVAGILEDEYGVDVDKLTTFPRTLRNAIVHWSRGLIRQRDASNFKYMSNVAEGSVKFGFAGQSSKDTESEFTKAERFIRAFGAGRSWRGKPRVHRVRRGRKDGAFD